MQKNVTERVFCCPDCGTAVTAYKKSSRRTAQGHTKHMYCWKCKDTKGFVQLSRYGLCEQFVNISKST